MRNWPISSVESSLDLPIPDPQLREALAAIASDVEAADGRAVLVGGSVRDALLGRPAEDLDIEVFGLDSKRLVALLDQRFDLDLVGMSFGVLKVRHLAIDVALPRRESKRGLGHRGFEVHSDPQLSFREAAKRRDFTVNAMGFDPLKRQLLDPWGGAQDLDDGILRHVSEHFDEDPLRVLRAMQMLARFDLKAAPETVERCRRIEPEGLPKERLLEEWRKLILQGRTISRGLSFLRQCGWVRYYPELEALIDCPQDPEWHPEGDVWIHTLHVLDAFVGERLGDPWEDWVVGLACLCHDFGKPLTTAFEDGRWRSKGHEPAGEPPTRSFLERLSNQSKLADEVVPLVREHLRPIQLFKSEASPAAVRRLAKRVGRIDRLIRVCRADHAGRPPIEFDDFPAGHWLLSQAEQLQVARDTPQPIVLGRHLIDLGLSPGAHFHALLEQCFEAQLDGEFDALEGGLSVAKQVVNGYLATSGKASTTS